MDSAQTLCVEAASSVDSEPKHMNRPEHKYEFNKLTSRWTFDLAKYVVTGSVNAPKKKRAGYDPDKEKAKLAVLADGLFSWEKVEITELYTRAHNNFRIASKEYDAARKAYKAAHPYESIEKEEVRRKKRHMEKWRSRFADKGIDVPDEVIEFITNQFDEFEDLTRQLALDTIEKITKVYSREKN